jgi:type II secretory pathway pseudopilin PulG
MNRMSMPSPSQAGNVLFFILIAIALFSALSFVVANMMRGGSPTVVSEEKASVFAAEILDYGRTLRQAVQNVRINGCDDDDISFSNIFVSGYAHSPVVSNTCKVFNAGGGAITYVTPHDKWLASMSSPPTLQGQWYFPANICVTDVGSGGAGCGSDSTDNEDLVVILPYIRQEICEKINSRLNLGASALSASDDAWPSAATKFTGSYSDDTSIDQSGTMAGCFEGDGANTPASGTYHFYQVLLAR